MLDQLQGALNLLFIPVPAHTCTRRPLYLADLRKRGSG